MQQMTHRFTIELKRLRRDSHDLCCACARRFRKAETSHSGYDDRGRPIYVGDCCSHLLAETAERTYFLPLPYAVPPSSARLWRYLDLSKLISLLKDKALYFPRSDRLGDPFEGAKGIVKNKKIWDEHYLNAYRQAVQNPPIPFRCTLSDEEVEVEARRLLREFEQAGHYDLTHTFVSCWHESDHESEALWRLYAREGGVAISTTFDRLTKALGDDPSIRIGRVEYLDFFKEFADINEAIFRKRKSFEHEKEVRAVVRIYESPPEYGTAIKVDLPLLIDSLYVSPMSPEWFADVVSSIIERYDFAGRVIHSSLKETPFF